MKTQVLKFIPLPELSCKVLKSTLLYIRKKMGDQALVSFVKETGQSLEFLQDENNWVSWEYYRLFLAKLVKITGNPNAPFEAGTIAATKEAWGSTFILFEFFGNVSFMIKKVVELIPTFNKAANWELREIKRNKAVIKIQWMPNVYTDSNCCRNRHGQVASLSTISGMPIAKVIEYQCQAKGDAFCLEEYTWINRPKNLYSLMGFLGSIAINSILRFYFPINTLGFLLGGILGYLLGSVLDYKKAIKENAKITREQNEALDNAVRSVTARYEELKEANDQLAKTHTELEKYKINLEDLVDSRTKELSESKKQLEESYAKLKELDRVKSDFFANVNHELRTPLTLILLPLEMVLNKEFGALSPAIEKNILTVKTNALRLLNLINGLLDLAKVDAGKMELYKSKNDLALIVQGVISSLSLMADQKKIRLSNVSRLSSPEIYFDREKIERVLINLISNALKFTNSGGSIQVSSEEKKGFAEIRVKDTGIGIPPNFLEKIFERFTQVDGSSSRKHQGTGLGLALCKEFVEMHQGKIRAESDGERGSVFIFTLPLVTTLSETPGQVDRRVEEFEIKTKRRNEDLTKSLAINALYQTPSWFTADEKEEIPPGDQDKQYQILVVEDHREMREFIRSILKKEYSVVTAGDGVEGMDKTKSCLPDLIISDVMMPLKDGYQLCREIKTDQNTRHIPVILLTAKSDLPSKLQGLALCADDYLSKPFNTDELRARVKSLLRLKELEKENAQSRKMAAMAVMVAGVVHEINNPLSFTKTSWATISESVERLKVILASCEFKNHQEEISELMNSAGPALEIVKQGIGRIEQVISRLRLFEGNRSLAFEPLEINRLMDHLIEMRAESDIFPQVGGAVFYKDYQMTHPVEGISILLGQTFDVMIDNALKATGGTGPVWVKTWQEGEEKAFISIRDNGIGIKKETLEHLFEPFFTLRDVGEGMGLGLFLAYQVILAHHGSITVKSEEGAGTEMMIHLPFHQPKSPLLPQDQPVQFIP